jgi:hypothetical protein
MEAKQAIEHHHRCPFRGCTNPVRDAMFACKVHWFQLDPWERQEIVMAMNERRAGVIDDSELGRSSKRFWGKGGGHE